MLRSTTGAVITWAVMGVLPVAVGSAAVASDLPFRITAPPLSGYHIQCNGEFYRTSGCVPFGPGAENGRVFYEAADNFIDPAGKWACTVYASSTCAVGAPKTGLQFCVPFDRKTFHVDLEYDGSNLTVNHKRYCGAAGASSVLGQTGEADDTPVQDVDTYRFAGQAGEKVEIKLGRDGSTGSLGEVATLRLRAQGGAVIAERTGAVPLALKATLSGPVEIAVSRKASGGDGLRGGYEVELIPESGDVDGRTLRPAEDVEG